MKWAMRVFVGGSAVLLLCAALLLVVARFMPLSLAPMAKPISAMASWQLKMQNVRILRPVLYWSHAQQAYALRAESISLAGRDNALIHVVDARFVLSGAALHQKWRLVPAEIDIAKVLIVPETANELPVAVDMLVPNMAATGDNLLADYLNLLAIRDIVIGDEDVLRDTKSHLLMTRDRQTLRLTASLTYQQGAAVSTANAVAYFKPGDRGHADIVLENINPRDIGRFSRLLSPLQGIRLPITAQIALDVDGQGAPLEGDVDLYIAPGEVLLADAPLSVSELTVGLSADFAEKRIALRDVRFNVDGVTGSLTGVADYTQNRNGQIERLTADLDGQGIYVNLPKLISQPLKLARLDTQVSYDVGADRVEIDRFTAAHNFGQTELTGAVTLGDSNPQFDVTARFGKMSRAAVNALWPVPIAPKVKKWADENLIDGRLRDGSISLTASLDELINRPPGSPMREDAFQLDLDFEDIGVRFIQQAPPLEGTRAKLTLRGQSFEVTTKGGQIWLPANDNARSLLAFADGKLVNPDYRDRAAITDIRFGASGQVDDIMRALGKPPFNVTRNIDFDFQRLKGQTTANVLLQLPLLAAAGQRKLTYDVQAASDDFSVIGKLGPYQISDSQVRLHIDPKRLTVTGLASVNGVATNVEWLQPFGEGGADKSRLLLSGKFSPQDFADLGQAWVGERFTGEIDTKVSVEGSINKPKILRVNADLKQARFMPRPLAYEKPLGEDGKINAIIRNNAAGEIATIDADIDFAADGAARQKGNVKMKFDGAVLSDLQMTPLSLGRDKNLQIALSRENEQTFTQVSADSFDVQNILGTANPDISFTPEPFAFLPFLGPDAIIEGQVANMLGAHNEAMQGVKVRLIRQKGLHEKLSFDGVFKDGTSVIAGIDRETDLTRSFAVQAENTGNILRLLDWQKEVYGGSLILQGTLFDSQLDGDGRRRDLDGRVTMVGFRARNVPVLASLFSLASLSGIADTLSGDGIKFRKLQSDFSAYNGKLTIDGGRMHGAAVGLTMQGDYDYARGAIDIGGTLVPAYTLNSFFGKIPLIGRILGGREGEGLVGIGYRVSGDDGKANVLVNPLSVLTPGVFRRIFELGIGLPDQIDDLIPDLPEEQLTE